MSEAIPAGALKPQDDAEVIKTKPAKTPENEAAHELRRRATRGKGREEKSQAQQALSEPDRHHSDGFSLVVGQHGVRDVPLEPCQ